MKSLLLALSLNRDAAGAGEPHEMAAAMWRPLYSTRSPARGRVLLRAMAAVLMLPLLAPPPASAQASVSCGGLPATIVGTEEDDRLVGTPLTDVIVGLGGDDDIEGGRGDDVLCGNAGDDGIGGNQGNDRSYGGLGSDLLDDTVVVEPTDLSGDDGDDQMYGGRGRDELQGHEGSDRLDAGRGNDFLVNAPGSDAMLGGSGPDTVAFFGTNQGVVVDLEAGISSGDVFGDDTIESIENVMGSDGNDTIIGTDKANQLFGMVGDDVLDGRAGKDRLDGGRGRDRCLRAEQQVSCETR